MRIIGVLSSGFISVGISAARHMSDRTPQDALSGDDIAQPSIVVTPFEERTAATAWQVLDEGARERLKAISQIITLAPHALLYAKDGEAEFVYNIIEGGVATYEHDFDGRRYISAFLFPSDLVGLSENGRYVGSAETLTPFRAYKIPIQGLAQTLKEDSRVTVGLLLKVCHDRRDSQRHAFVLSHYAAHRRLASFFLWLSDALALRTADAHRIVLQVETITLPMSRRDIADYLGLSVESISRALQLLEADGAIRRNGARTIDILDRAALQALSAHM